jgi:hypothetical protein
MLPSGLAAHSYATRRNGGTPEKGADIPDQESSHPEHTADQGYAKLIYLCFSSAVSSNAKYSSTVSEGGVISATISVFLGRVESVCMEQDWPGSGRLA